MRSMTRKNVRSTQPNPSGAASSRTMYRSSTRSRTGLLYHRQMSRPPKRPTQKWLVGLALLGAAVLAHERLDAAGPVDRLDQFRQLAISHGSADGSPDAYRDMYALLDEEIVERLGNGCHYAWPAFLQARLGWCGTAWGGEVV